MKKKFLFAFSQSTILLIFRYCSDGDISRARSKFFHSQKSFLLITERFHFYKRYKIRNIQHLFFYSLPEFPFVYQDFMNMVESGASSAVALYSKFDLLKLERIVGRSRMSKLLTSSRNTFIFS